MNEMTRGSGINKRPGRQVLGSLFREIGDSCSPGVTHKPPETAFANSRLVDVTADAIEQYLCDRPGSEFASGSKVATEKRDFSKHQSCTRSSGGLAGVTQMPRQGDVQIFKKYSQMKLQMKRDALMKLDRQAGEMARRLANECAQSVVQ